jgi:hypothetical protein
MTDQLSLQIICLQTHLTHYHYQSYSILKYALLERIRRGIRTSTINNTTLNNTDRAHTPTLVILPECTGTWFYLMCVPMPNYLREFFFNNQYARNNRHRLFVVYTLLTHFYRFIKELYRNYHRRFTWLGLIKRSWFTLFSRQTYALYEQLFSELACETHCTIVAGSTFMHDRTVSMNFCNMSGVFEPDHGSMCLLAGKYYPVSDEKSFLDCYHDVPMIYSIPHTNVDIAVLICADSWMPTVYDQYQQLDFNVNRRFIFVIVALNTGQWNMPWPGYDITCDMPDDVNRIHVNTLPLGQAWHHYAIQRAFNMLTQRCRTVGYGVVCCQGLLNSMNEIEAEGESIILIKRSFHDDIRMFEAKTYQNEQILTCEF